MEKIFNYLNVGKNEPYYDLFESEILRYGFLKTTFNGLCLECAIYKTELAQILNSDIENFGFIYKRGKRELSKIFKIKDYQIRIGVIPKIKYSIFFKPLETAGFILKGNNNNDFIDIKKLNYREIYSIEFQKGIEKFNRNFGVPNEIKYNPISLDLYINDLKDNYFHNKIDNIYNEYSNKFGWNFVKNSYPKMLSESEIKKYAFYSGIVYAADKLISEHRTILKGFYECENKTHTETPIKKENPTISPETAKKLSLRQIALKYAIESKTIDKNNSNEIANLYNWKCGEKLVLEFNKVRNNKNRVANSESDRILKAKIKDFEIVIEVIDVKYKDKAIKELEIIKTYIVN